MSAGFGRVLPGADGVVDSDDDIEVLALWDRGLDGAPGDRLGRGVPRARGRAAPAGRVGDRWEAPGLSLRLVATGAPAGLAAENARGLALCVELGGLRLLAPGDLPAAQAAVAAADVRAWSICCGRRTTAARNGTSEAVLAAADPALVVISAGRDNPYCHPVAGHPRAAARSVRCGSRGSRGPGRWARCAGLATSFGAQSSAACRAICGWQRRRLTVLRSERGQVDGVAGRPPPGGRVR
jgi:hypothetical protein